MLKNYVVGFPRIGEQRELKKVLELFWADKCPFSEVEKVALELREINLSSDYALELSKSGYWYLDFIF